MSSWKSVEEALSKGRPQTAIELLEPILTKAKAEENWAEAAKALTKKISYQGMIEGGKAEEKIGQLEAEIAEWPEAAQPILETILGYWYWQFYQQNQWRFLQRTQSDEPPGEDILSWDLATILAEIDSHFVKALADPEKLRAEPIERYDDLLEKGNVPDSYRPTLYDFIAYEALRFYTSGEQAGAKSQDAFGFSADSPAFGTVAEFLAWQPDTTDEDSQSLKAIRLLQELIKSHEDGTNARADADLARLSFAYNTAYGANKDERYIAALKAFADHWSTLPISARARADWAGVVRSQGDLVSAHAIAKVGRDAHPDTAGGDECHNIIEEIERPQVEVTTERAWSAPWPQVQVKYKNVTQAHFRIYSYRWEDLLNDDHWQVEHLSQKQALAMLRGKPVVEWSVDLPSTDDYQLREELVDVPGQKDLEKGFYFVVSSHHPSFEFDVSRGNVTSIAPVWVSDLAVIIRSEYGDGKIGGLVLDAVSGNPIEGAEITAYRMGNKRNRRDLFKGGKTNADGLFSLKSQNNQGHIIMASHEGDRITTLNDQSNYKDRRDGFRSDDVKTWFFTDRSIYRPGQTIQFKGLVTKTSAERNTYKVAKSKKITVVFADVNNQEIERQTFQTNDYGSFSGSFTAPRDRLMGRMRLYTQDGDGGTGWVTVEEYKRPKFKVTVDPPEAEVRLDDEVTVSGNAMTYSGAAVGGAEVKYRVVREVRYPAWWAWCYWWLPARGGESQEIAHGETETGVDGKFDITFTALPDRMVDEADEPTFHYTIHADVTDPTGETRSDSQSVAVGYTALKAQLSASDWQRVNAPVEIQVNTQTIAGQPIAAKGEVVVYRLKEPGTVQRPALQGGRRYYPEWVWVDGQRQRYQPEPDMSDPNSWELGDAVETLSFATDESGNTKLSVELPVGIYRAMLSTHDQFGKDISARLPIEVLDPASPTFSLKLPHRVASAKWTAEPGESFEAIWGTGYDTGRAYIEIEHRGKNIFARWTNPRSTQSLIQQIVDEEHRGGFTLRVTQMRENRAYISERRIDVPWSNKKLSVKWAHHTDKLEPGQKETWTATVSGPDAESAVAEIAAALYDESLDAYLPHQWMNQFSMFYQDHSRLRSEFQNQVERFDHFDGRWKRDQRRVDWRYRSFPRDLYYEGRGRSLFYAKAPVASARMKRSAAPVDGFAPPMPMAAAPAMAMEAEAMADEGVGFGGGGGGELREEAVEQAALEPDLDKVSVRENLNETAFFFPNLVTNADGTVDLEFTMPEALTSWKFMAFAHDTELRSGFLTDSVVTQKDIMVQPNPPRFIREGDELEFTVKVINLSEVEQSGTVRLSFANLRTEAAVSEQLGLADTDQAFAIPAQESRTYSWRMAVPDGMGYLSYQAVASTGKLSDGERGAVPVLPRRILVTESIPLPVRDAQTKEFAFQKLIDSAQSDTLQHQSLTVQMVSNPSWYAVMALPYLMEYPHQCSEQIFNRLYANALGSHIVGSDPKIERIFDQWRGTDALDSPLEKNEDLKAVMLEETPWVQDAHSESQARRNVAVLFDDNRLGSELRRAQKQLAERQNGDGRWSWFPGGRGNDYITLYVTTGYARLRHLGVEGIDMGPAQKAVASLDRWLQKRYDYLVEKNLLDDNNLNPTIALYLYCRSFYLEEQPIPKEHRAAVDYFVGEAREHWLEQSRQTQGHIALALHRVGIPEVPQDIVISLREHAKNEEEMGMYWRDTEYSYWWYRAPIETQALMIEVFDEVAKDQKAVEDLQVWLLKQKQTQDWKTTKATADAVYAMLLRGSDLLASDQLVEVSLGDLKIEPKNVEAGTGFYEQKLVRGEVQPSYGEVTVTKHDKGVAWGSVHWQYFESMEKITPHDGTPLQLVKKLYTKVNTKQGPKLTAVKPGDALEVGDELVVRLELRSDRDMEYLHLKDQRGAGTEPVNVLSGYRYQDGLGYYESTRDTASHFFIDYLPKGTYVFEYSVRVQHRGSYQSGMANIQCMYAPEFNSHSESFALEVK